MDSFVISRLKDVIMIEGESKCVCIICFFCMQHMHPTRQHDVRQLGNASFYICLWKRVINSKYHFHLFLICLRRYPCYFRRKSLSPKVDRNCTAVVQKGFFKQGIKFNFLSREIESKSPRIWWQERQGDESVNVTVVFFPAFTCWIPASFLLFIPFSVHHHHNHPKNCRNLNTRVSNTSFAIIINWSLHGVWLKSSSHLKSESRRKRT